jgi:hypothetical protein
VPLVIASLVRCGFEAVYVLHAIRSNPCNRA